MIEQMSVPNFANIHAWTALSGMSERETYRSLEKGELRAIKKGRRTLIDVHAGMAHLAALPEAKIGQNRKPQTLPTTIELLKQAAAQAVAEHIGDSAAAREAFLALCTREMLLALFKPWQAAATTDYLRNAAKARQPKRDDGQGKIAGKASLSVPSSRSTSRSCAFSAEAAQAVRQTESRNLLMSFLVNGKPIAEVTALEARGWAKSRNRDARFVELLAAGVPDMAKIGSCRTAREAEALYVQAKKETADA